MDVLVALARAASQAYPALLVIILASLGANLWAFRRRRFGVVATMVVVAAVATLLYTGGEPAEALARLSLSPSLSAAHAVGPVTATAGTRAPSPGRAVAPPRRDRSKPSYALRWRNRLPDDFPVPPVFQFEYSTGQQSRNRTIRYRFRGEPANAVRDLREMGTAGGWQVEVKAPHRLVFRKGDRMVEAWFSYAARSVVLDVTDGRG